MDTNSDRQAKFVYRYRNVKGPNGNGFYHLYTSTDDGVWSAVRADLEVRESTQLGNFNRGFLDYIPPPHYIYNLQNTGLPTKLVTENLRYLLNLFC